MWPDGESGLYYAPHRYYSPFQARWTTRDPLGMVDGPNVYAYVRGNPVNFRDPLGLFLLDIVTDVIEPLSELAGEAMDYITNNPTCMAKHVECLVMKPRYTRSCHKCYWECMSLNDGHWPERCPEEWFEPDDCTPFPAPSKGAPLPGPILIIPGGKILDIMINPPGQYPPGYFPSA